MQMLYNLQSTCRCYITYRVHVDVIQLTEYMYMLYNLVSLVYIYMNSTAYSLKHYWYMYGPFKYVLFITQTNFPDTYLEKGFIFLQVLNFLPYFTYRHEITHMMLQVKIYPIMDGTNNENSALKNQLFTCTHVLTDMIFITYIYKQEKLKKEVYVHVS